MKEWKADLEFFRRDMNVPVIISWDEIKMPVQMYGYDGEWKSDMSEEGGRIAVLNDGSSGWVSFYVSGN